MEVIDGAALPAELSPPPQPVCVLLQPLAGQRMIEAARWAGVEASMAERLWDSVPRRPLLQAEDGQISVIAFAVDELGRAMGVHLHAGERGLLVLCPDPTATVISRAIAGIDGGPHDALIAASRGLLFSLQQLWMAHRQVLASDDLRLETLTRTARSGLRRARGTFEASGTTASQLYALLGDTLSRQATVISERLTLAAVIFLPLTVSTGFFGMNFGWLTTQIGSAAAFVLLGIVLPGALVTATLLGARWLSHD